jgi:mannose-6-phosphate isomerase-like protein (cupin superfamily)
MQGDRSFGQDPVDVYSEPTAKRSTLFGKVFYLPRRTSAAKPNRSLAVVWDARQPLVDGFHNSYSYLVRFNHAHAVAGNHYHHEKDEIFHAVIGRFRIVLEDIETKEREEVALDSDDNMFLYVPHPVAHAIQAVTDNAVLLTLASHPNLDTATVRYHMIQDPTQDA